MKSRLVISTVGTSLLTNQIDRDIDPEQWSQRVQQTANFSKEEIKYHQDVLDIIDELKQRAEEKLNNNSDTQDIRKASAELNGIYGLYDDKLEQGVSDVHVLIATDTAQGKVTAEIVESFLKSKGLTQTSTYIQDGLSITSSNSFVEGLSKLIPFIKNTVDNCKASKYEICFNLVGGFKALQGYFNTIGMFYADEINYIFEQSNELIKIPKLPIKVDTEKVEPYKVQLAMMSVGEIPTSWEEAGEVPKDWVLEIGQEMTLSAWGQLLWNECKNELLSQDKLLQFPNIEYNPSFKDEYKAKPGLEKAILQENLARAACLLLNNSDGISAMKQDGIFRLRRYEGKNKDVDHFDLPKDRRVSCVASNSKLQLRHYGEHNYVNDNP